MKHKHEEELHSATRNAFEEATRTAREESEREKKEFEELKMEELKKQMEEEKENFQLQSTQRIDELQEKVQKAVKKGKSMQAERDEIKTAFDALDV